MIPVFTKKKLSQILDTYKNNKCYIGVLSKHIKFHSSNLKKLITYQQTRKKQYLKTCMIYYVNAYQHKINKIFKET